MSADYPFEHLNPERFQEFCQALLVKEFPGIQCFPVGQPDGGRDAFVYNHFSQGDSKSIVFQVKFSRKPSEVSDPVQWLTDIAEGEREKVKRLVSAGAKTYYLMTNVAGTAHLGAGSIDKVEKALSDILGIHAHCMWRADLCRRLDNAWNLKWSYPELMTGPDLIRYAIEQGLNEHATRRANAIRAFVRAQYAVDEQVKFKQVDLQNHLLDLFVDVPLNERQFSSEQAWRAAVIAHEFDDHIRERRIGAAAFLLRGASSNSPHCFVLEGAPGQGKSTISQYISQVHRIRLLERAADLARIPEEHRTGGIELPIKADLRDFATWLARKNPFGSSEGPEHLLDWAKTLEAFLAAMIRHQSGGAAFDVSDLHAILSRSAAILVLDGLDEVADVRRRAEVVAEISKGVERLGSIASALRVVVTSRPAAFANSPGLKRENFTYISLGDLTKDIIVGYAEKWLRALRAEAGEANSVRAILNHKLDQPHIRDLARNPMQLAILLSLIHTKGVSLPDKRTALYDSYVDLFFSREAEKSAVVREHRDLLLNIHRYLAWMLHSEAELSNTPTRRSNGAIEGDRLKKVVRAYLAADNRDESLADALFTGVVERVVALVSRVEGTYEFEVQPLREFFAARYLYETAPYSPPGNEKKGTKPDRFDAVARNFYWLNVTRFLAGCYSIGELASLIDSLKELLKAPAFANLRHPRILAATLLGDWVFAQQNRSVTAVSNLLVDDLGFRLLLVHTSSRSGDGNTLVFPKGCGNEQLTERGFQLLNAIPAEDFAFDIAELLRSISSSEELMPKWAEGLRTSRGDNVKRWIAYGKTLGCLSKAPFELVLGAIKRGNLGSEIVGSLVLADRTDLLEHDANHLRDAVDIILGSSPTFQTPTAKRLSSNRPIAKLVASLNPYRFARAFHDDPKINLDSLRIAEPKNGEIFTEIDPPLAPESAEREKLLQFLKGIEPLGQIAAGTWQSSLGPWTLLIDALHKAYGDRELNFVYAVMASSIRNPAETCSDSSDFFDATTPLVRRTRYARLRTDAVKWWKNALGQAVDAERLARLCATWIISSSRETFQQTSVEFDASIAKLSLDDWGKVYRLVQRCLVCVPGPRQIRKSGLGWEVFEKLSPRTKILLASRFSATDAEVIRTAIMEKGGDLDLPVLNELQSVALRNLARNSVHWQRALNVCAELFARGATFEKKSRYQYQTYSEHSLRVAVAEEIMRDPSKYPTLLLARAERAYHLKTSSNTKPIAVVSSEEGWFEGESLKLNV